MSARSRMRILITNDDGIHAPGLKALTRVAKTLSDDVWVVAPESEQSAMSHALTVRRPLRIRKHGPKRFGVDGTPSDCVLIAVTKILVDRPPDLVLSGINHGANLGEDILYSGTVAGAMEASILGFRAIAFSQLRSDNKVISWASAEKHLPGLIKKLDRFAWVRNTMINVNLPALPANEVKGARACRQGWREDGIYINDMTDPRGNPSYWIGDFASDRSLGKPDDDLSATTAGYISVTPLHVDMTAKRALDGLKELIG